MYNSVFRPYRLTGGVEIILQPSLLIFRAYCRCWESLQHPQWKFNVWSSWSKISSPPDIQNTEFERFYTANKTPQSGICLTDRHITWADMRAMTQARHTKWHGGGGEWGQCRKIHEPMNIVWRAWDFFKGPKNHHGCVAQGWRGEDYAAMECIKMLPEGLKNWRILPGCHVTLYKKPGLPKNISTHYITTQSSPLWPLATQP